MSNTYDPHAIEPYWQAVWAATRRDVTNPDHAERPFYNLMEFPYPSGEGLHVGHVFSFGGADTYGRFQRRRGFQVFQPMGFDAFGIHSENYALRTGEHPFTLTRRTTARFRQQLQRLGGAFDWDREVDTTDPRYYRWTQWIFIQLYKAGLAYRAEANVNWCPSCKTVLANEQVIDGRCERCDTSIAQRRMKQWFFRITQYADRLLDFSRVDFSETVIKRQRAWIGRSEGAEIEFAIGDWRLEIESPQSLISNLQSPISVFTTRPDTINGVTFIALAPEHPLSEAIARGNGTHAEAVRTYIESTRGRLELERQQAEPTGAYTGLTAINPVNGDHVPVWVADYVLMGYGTGAIMGVPAHDERDARFAERYALATTDHRPPTTDHPRTTDDGQPTTDDNQSPISPTVRYRLRDWLISRQRYWGPPIPIIYCERCGAKPVPEEQLPVMLPPLEQFRPTGSGVAPLATVPEFVNTICPVCDGPAQRETDVSDNFLDSAWYFLRYLSTERDDVAWDNTRVCNWLPVAMYTGGPEHATMHHLYARFITMALHDLGLLPIDEPFQTLRLHGMITHSGRKMSKSRGNVVNPDEYIQQYGADTTRMALLFLGPFDQDADFDDRSFVGMARFLRRVWELGIRGQGSGIGGQGSGELEQLDGETRRPGDQETGNQEIERSGDRERCDAPHTTDSGQRTTDSGQWITDHRQLINTVIRRVTEDLEQQQFHTAIAALMEYTNWLRAEHERMASQEADEARRTLVLLLAPFAPHICEELWARMGGVGSVHDQPWPAAQDVVETTVTLPVQVNGRVRGHIHIAPDADQARIQAAALAANGVREAIDGVEVRRVVVVPGRIVNIVTGE
jgi:leucyl-tRNA synthetase